MVPTDSQSNMEMYGTWGVYYFDVVKRFKPKTIPINL